MSLYVITECLSPAAGIRASCCDEQKEIFGSDLADERIEQTGIYDHTTD